MPIGERDLTHMYGGKLLSQQCGEVGQRLDSEVATVWRQSHDFLKYRTAMSALRCEMPWITGTYGDP